MVFGSSGDKIYRKKKIGNTIIKLMVKEQMAGLSFLLTSTDSLR